MQVQLVVPMAVVFGPGSVPGDLPRPLPFRDVQEMEISVNRESPRFLSLPRPLLMGGLVLSWASQPARDFSPRQPAAPGTPDPIPQHRPALGWQSRERGVGGSTSCREGTTHLHSLGMMEPSEGGMCLAGVEQ